MGGSRKGREQRRRERGADRRVDVLAIVGEMLQCLFFYVGNLRLCPPHPLRPLRPRSCSLLPAFSISRVLTRSRPIPTPDSLVFSDENS